MSPPAAIEIGALTDTPDGTIPDPFTALLKNNEIFGRRKKMDKSQWGVAAPADSVNFRLQKHDHKPLAKRWDNHMTPEALSRTGNSLKKAAKYLSQPGLISLGGGLPSSEYFPFNSLSLNVPVPPHFASPTAPSPQNPTTTSGTGTDTSSTPSSTDTTPTTTTLHAGKHDLTASHSLYDLATALNYAQGSGSAQLLRFATEHTERVHNPPYADWRTTLSVGSTSALDMLFRMLVRRGEAVLSEAYTFATAVETAAPLGVRVFGVGVDGEGMVAGALEGVLRDWGRQHGWEAVPRPKVLYTVPTGQNPTGATQGEGRRREIYEVARKYDLVVIEDEPYYFLQMEPYRGAGGAGAGQGQGRQQGRTAPLTHAEFLASLVPSLLSMDVDGRVVRLDSFSKVVSPGARVGWVTGSEQLVTAYMKHADVSTQSPSGVSQLVLWKLLDEYWGHAGFLDWLIFLRAEYTRRRDVMLRACERYLPREVVSWEPPMAGMFHWMRIDYPKHPSYPAKSIQELEEEIWLAGIEAGALVMRGSWFYADKTAPHDTMFFRATYAAVPADRLQEAIRRFGDALRVSFGLEVKNSENGVENGGEKSAESKVESGVSKEVEIGVEGVGALKLGE